MAQSPPAVAAIEGPQICQEQKSLSQQEHHVPSARLQRLASGHAALERRDIDAEEPGRQALVHRRQDGGPPRCRAP